MGWIEPKKGKKEREGISIKIKKLEIEIPVEEGRELIHLLSSLLGREEESSQLADEVEQKKKKLEKCKGEVEALKGDIENLTDEKDNIEKELEEWKKTAERLKGESEEIRKKLEECKSQLKEQSRLLESRKKELEAVKLEKKQLETEIDRWQRKLREKEEEWKGKFAQSEKERYEYKRLLEECKKEVKTLSETGVEEIKEFKAKKEALPPRFKRQVEQWLRGSTPLLQLTEGINNFLYLWDEGKNYLIKHRHSPFYEEEREKIVEFLEMIGNYYSQLKEVSLYTPPKGKKPERDFTDISPTSLIRNALDGKISEVILFGIKSKGLKERAIKKAVVELSKYVAPSQSIYSSKR